MNLHIRTSPLDYTNYLNSLIKEALKRNLIKEQQLEIIYIQIGDLFIYKAKRFTLGDSSSIPEETANHILSSIQYTIGIELQSIQSINKQIKFLISEPIQSIFENGLKKVKNLFKKAKIYHMKVKETMLPLDILAYNDTLTNGLNIFFKEYDAEFFSHESPGSIDYPLAYDEMNTTGVQYTIDYLKKVYLENLLCRKLRQKDILKLLNYYDRNYKVLLFNVFKVILHNIIGSIILHKNINNLFLTEYECRGIYEKISFYDNEDYYKLYRDILDYILTDNLKQDTFSKNYLSSIIFDSLNSLRESISNNNSYTFFTLTGAKKTNSKLKFIDNKSLDDEIFRGIFNEISSLRYFSDKIRMLNTHPKSIKDLIDFLNGDIFSEGEYYRYFITLTTNEISLILSQSIFYGNPIEKDFLNQFNILPKKFNFEEFLYRYVLILDKSEVNSIIETLKSLEDIS